MKKIIITLVLVLMNTTSHSSYIGGFDSEYTHSQISQLKEEFKTHGATSICLSSNTYNNKIKFRRNMCTIEIICCKVMN